MKGLVQIRWVGLICLLLSGCRSLADYRAAELPAELRMTESEAPGQVDLSAIARRTLNADIIYPGDLLEVSVATGIEEREPNRWPLRVQDDGNVEVPLVGDVHVAGLALTEAEVAIREASIEREVYRKPHVAVVMRQRRMVHVRVMGAVKTPGVHPLPAAGGDLLAAIVAAGGLAENAGTEIEIRHPNSNELVDDRAENQGVRLASFVETADTPARVVTVDLADREQLAAEPDLHVEDGTVVVVHERNKRSISVIGLVQRPNTYELPLDEPVRVLDALALAGGPTNSLADRVRVIRQSADREEPVTIAVSIREAKRTGKENLVLGPGDVVEVQETPATFVVETIRGFIRFGFTSALPAF